MSLSAVVGNALSGLQASQASLRASSNNVANVNTPGYARTIANLQSRNVAGSAMGVQVAGITRIADKYLQVASLKAISVAGATQVAADQLDRLQAQFGGLDDPGSLFSRLNNVLSGFSQASVDPSLSVSRLSAAADLQSFFDEAERLSIEVRAQRLEADGRINTTLARSNEILNELFELNGSVQNLSSVGGDTSGAANRQAELLDELSALMDISAAYQQDGRVVVRTGDGVLLVDNFALKLEYQPPGSGAYEISYGKILAVPPGGTAGQELDSHIASGELASLLEMRDETMPNIALELAELAAGAADAVNQAHNNAASYPAPQSLTGRNTGLLGADLHNFSGQTTLAVTDTSGQLVRRIDVDFDAGTLSANGGAAAALGTTVDSLTAAINTALGGDGSASFSNGVMNISATSAANGIASVQDDANPSNRGGRGFSHFFGLNDLVRSTRPSFFQTGMTGAEAHGFTAGTSMSFRVESPNGGLAGSASVTMAAGGSVNDILTGLNDLTTGLGRYATFSLDANGALLQTPNAGYENFKIELTADDTARPGVTTSFSDLFGIGLQARAGRAEILSVDPAILTNGARMSLGQLDIGALTAVGDTVLTVGDSRGGLALQQAFATVRSFEKAGSLAGSSAGLQDYAARFAGQVGSRANRAQSEADSAAVLRETAQQKRANVEGVNLDEELANMTLFQQSYNASARMLQAAKDMTDALMSIV
jgi:flagellar hook-associated protein 1 FlgK